MFEAFMGSIPGPYHEKNGLENQDAALFHENDRGIVVAAVADGAGSLKFSAEGAYIAVEGAVAAADEVSRFGSLLDMTMRGLDRAREKQRGIDGFKEYGSTLVVAAINSMGEWAVSAVGDSFAVVHTLDTHILVTGTPVGEYANITELLTSDTIHPVHLTGQGAVGITLCSDGLEQVAIALDEEKEDGARRAHAGFWDGIRDRALKSALDISALFDWLNTQDRIVDDTTMLTVVRR